MNIYMGFSRCNGSYEGAALIFAHSVREAKKVGWRECGNLFTDEFTDFSVRLLKDSEWLYQEANQEKLRNDIAHTIDNPHSCKRCECWGQSEILDNGLCEDCNAELEME